MTVPAVLPQFVASATYSSNGTNSANVALVCPASAQVDDTMVVFATFGAGIALADPVSGWTTLARAQGSTSVESWGLYAKKVVSGDPGSTFNFPLSTGVSRQAQGHMRVYRYVDLVTPSDVAPVGNSVGSVTSDPVLSANTSATDSTMSVGFWFPYYSSNAADQTVVTEPTGWSNKVNSTNATTTARKQIFSYDRVNGTAGSQAGWTLDMSTDPNTWMTAHVLLRPMFQRVAKTHAVSYDVAGSLTRVSKTHAASWNVGGRVAKTLAASWNVSSLVAELTYPVYVAHRGGPGSEETLDTYRRSYTQSPSFVGEGDMQLLSTGESVLMHDATIDRTADASGTPTTGSISALTLAQWRTSRVADLDGTGQSPQPPGEVSQLGSEYGAGTNKPRVLCLEVKDTGSGSTHVSHLTTYGLKGNTIVNCSIRSDAQAASAAGYETMYQTNVPNYANLAADGVKHLSVGSGSIDAAFCATAHSNGIKVWAYTVNTTTLRDSLLAMGVDGFFSDDPSVLAGVTRVSKTHAVSWNLLARVAKTVAASFDVLTRASKTHQASYDVASRVAKTHSVSYDVAARVAKTAAASWNTAARVVKTHAASWNLAARVVKTHAVSYDVAGSLTRVSKTHGASWDVRSRVPKTHQASYDVGQRVPKTHQVSYDVRARVVKAVAASWAVQTRVAKSHAVSWNVSALASAVATFYLSDGTTWVQQVASISDGTTWKQVTTKVSNGASWN